MLSYPQLLVRGVVEDIERNLVPDTAAAQEVIGDDPWKNLVEAIGQHIAQGDT